MSQPRKRDWTFKESIVTIAAELKVPYTRVYNALPRLGLTEVKNEDDLKRLALQLLEEDGITVEGLIKVFGPQTTLSQLAKEAAALCQHHA